jgi:membrane peptidoglycan carboxypeptidase
MMRQVVEQGTGQRARIDGWQIAGKSGTTNAARDAWFIGFTGDYVTGVWMGYDNNTPLSGVTGGGLPAEIWHEVMVRVLDGLPPVPLPEQEPTAPGFGGQVFNSGDPSGIGIGQIFEGNNPLATGAPSGMSDQQAEQVLQDVLTGILNQQGGGN